MEDKTIRQYTIREFANKMGVSVDFIRYYENLGAIHAHVNPSNHYHYYEVAEAENVYFILYYRSLGFNAKEILRLLGSSDKPSFSDLLSEKTQRTNAEIERLRLIFKEEESLLNTVRTIPDKAWYIIQMPSIYFLPCAINDELLGNPNMELLTEWNKALPFVKYCTRWVIESAPDGHAQFTHFEHGRMVRKEDADKLHLPCPPETVLIFPAFRCFEYHMHCPHSNKHHETHLTPIRKFSEAFEILRNQNLHIQNDMFSRVAYIYEENGAMYEHQILHIPLKL